MKKNGRILQIILLLTLLVIAVMPCMAAGQDGGTGRSGRSVTKIDLGVSSLILEIGDSYKFNVTYDPADTAYPYLRWYSSNDAVISIDGIHFTITALSPGSAVIYAESLDSVSHAVCNVQVNGAVGKDAADLIPGSKLVPLTETERAEITSGPLKSFLAYVLSTDFSEDAYQKAAQREFMVAADVVPGTEKAESQKALSLGMAASYPLENLNMITLQGTFEQIMDFISGDPDLLEIFGGELYFPDTLKTEETTTEESSETQKLEGYTEEITHVSIAHNFGYTGEGITIAILDSGLNKDHEQFQGRVIREKCFTSSTTEQQDKYKFTTKAVCTGGATEADSSLADFSLMNSDTFQAREGVFSYIHGSHAAGIAAGRDGIAPKANIVAVQIFSWGEYTCKEGDDDDEDENTNAVSETCYMPVETTPDKYRAYNYILGLNNGGIRVDVVNMSYGDSTENGGGGFSSVCDTVRPRDAALFKRMTEAGIIPVSASGNESLNDKVHHPACVSDVFSVGSCTKYDDSPDSPVYISAFSDHSRDLVDILAPGNRIRSASLFDPEIYESESKFVLSTKSYTKESGTSMAAPMVSGAFALLKQAVPGRTVAEYKKMILDISRSETKTRRDPFCNDPGKCTYNYEFPYQKTVLNFDGFSEFLENTQVSVRPEQRSDLFYRLGSADVLPKTGFSVLEAEKLSAQPLSIDYAPTHMTIQLATMDVESEIVTVPFIDGDYPAEWLGGSVGMLEGSSLPGEGLTILIGHNHLNQTETGPFALLKYMEKGDRFFVNSADNELSGYIVYANEKIAETDIEALERLAGTRQNVMILLTCEDERPEGGYAYRRVILADPVF